MTSGQERQTVAGDCQVSLFREDGKLSAMILCIVKNARRKESGNGVTLFTIENKAFELM